MIFVNVKNAPGIEKAHQIWVERMRGEEHSSRVRDHCFLIKFIFCSEVLCLPVHFFWLCALRKILRLRTVGVFHGFANKEHYSPLRYYLLKIAQWITWRTTNIHVYNSKLTLNCLMHDFQSERQNNDFIIYPTQKAYRSIEVSSFECRHVVYFGRMVAAKNVHLIMREFKKSRVACSHKLILFGGFVDKTVQTELEELETNGRILYFGDYHNHLSLREKLKKLGCSNGFFISWNESEPFGLVYQEAIELGLLPLLPFRAGFAEIIPERIAKQICFDSLESAFSAIAENRFRAKLGELKRSPVDDINAFSIHLRNNQNGKWK